MKRERRGPRKSRTFRPLVLRYCLCYCTDADVGAVGVVDNSHVHVHALIPFHAGVVLNVVERLPFVLYLSSVLIVL